MPRSAGVCHSQSAFKIGRTRSLAIPTAASAWPSGRGENDQPPTGREMVYMRYPGCRMGMSPTLRENGGTPTRAQHTAEAFCLHPSPFPGVGWGASDLGLTPAVRKGKTKQQHKTQSREPPRVLRAGVLAVLKQRSRRRMSVSSRQRDDEGDDGSSTDSTSRGSRCASKMKRRRSRPTCMSQV